MLLLEREKFLAELDEWLAAVPISGGAVALVAGEAGVGKTVLVQEFARRQKGARVLWGACDALFTPRPLAPLYDVARATGGALLAAVESKATRDQIFTAALDEFEREPSLVILEDMHWADEATFDLLKFIGRRIARTPTLLVVTYRDDEAGPRHPLRFAIGDLPRASTRRIVLAPLSEAGVATLAASAGQAAGDLYGITGGNPFFVTEVLAAASDTVPVTVRDAVLAHALRLSSPARVIAELICVVPGRTEAWLLAGTVPAEEAAIENCMGIGMLRHADGALSFRHELARRALEDALTPARREELHARVLAVLAARPGIAAARIAHHAVGAGDAEAVSRFAPLAAAQATAVGAHREAAAHYQAALRHGLVLAPGATARLQERLAYACSLIGEYELGIEAEARALATWRASGDRIREGDTLRLLSRLSWFVGRGAEANRYAIEAVAALESQPPGPELARAYCNRADLELEAHAAESAIAWARRSIDLAKAWADDEVLCDALNVLGTMRLIVGDLAGWTDLYQCLSLALGSGYHEQVASAYMSLAAMAVSRREYAQASHYLAEGIQLCERRDMDSLRLYMLAYRARQKFECGDWEGASDDAAAVLDDPRTTPVSRIPVLRTLAHLRIRRGDPGVEELLAEVRSLGGPLPELQRIGTLAAIVAEANWLAGNKAAVLECVRPAFERSRLFEDPRMNGELAVWLARAGGLKGRLPALAEPYALEIAGDWQRAAAAWEALGCRYEAASLLAWHGREPEQRRALAIFEELGAAPALEALRRKLRAQGVRGVPRGLRASTRKNALGLTKREAQVLELVAEGLRNAEIAKKLFLSTKTVDHHVSSILTKLAVPTRAAAAAVMRANAADAPDAGELAAASQERSEKGVKLVSRSKKSSFSARFRKPTIQ